MIKLFVIVLLVIAAYLAVVLNADPGYVLITFRDYSVETTLLPAILAVVVCFVAFVVLWKVLRFIDSLFHRDTWHRMFSGRAKESAEPEAAREDTGS